MRQLVLAAVADFQCATAMADVSVPVSVREAAGTLRVQEPASGGVPSSKGRSGMWPN